MWKRTAEAQPRQRPSRLRLRVTRWRRRRQRRLAATQSRARREWRVAWAGALGSLAGATCVCGTGGTPNRMRLTALAAAAAMALRSSWVAVARRLCLPIYVEIIHYPKLTEIDGHTTHRHAGLPGPPRAPGLLPPPRCATASWTALCDRFELCGVALAGAAALSRQNWFLAAAQRIQLSARPGWRRLMRALPHTSAGHGSPA